MATVRLSFSPFPAHVRTARLVGVAVARRAGVADAKLDEVRLAIGEACSRAVALHHRHDLSDLIDVELQDDDQFTVRVTDRAPTDPKTASSLSSSDSDTLEFPSPIAIFGEPGAAVRIGEPAAPARQAGTGVADPSARPGNEPHRSDSASDALEALDEEDVAAGMGLTLLVGLVDDLSVRPAPFGGGTEVEMSWPTGPRR